MELGLKVSQDLNLLASLQIKGIAYGCIEGAEVVLYIDLSCCSFFHAAGTGNELVNIKTGASNGQQTYWGEYRKASAYVVGNDVALVSFFVGCNAGCALFGIGNGYDDFACILFATLVFTLLAEQTESKGGFGGGARFGDVDDSKFLIFQIIAKFIKVVFTNVVSCEKNVGVFTLIGEPLKTILQSFNDGTCTQVTTADTGYYNGVAVCTQGLSSCLDIT